MKVYLIRHGQTEGNKNKLIQGWLDVKLTEKGQKQASALAPRFRDYPFDRKFCSDLFRTRQTGKLIFGEDAEFEFDERLRELNSTPVAGRSRDELRAEYGEKFDYAARNLDYSAFGGESFEELKARAKLFLQDLEKDTVSEKVAVVTHGGVIHAMVSNILGVKQTMPYMLIPNCSVTLLEYTNNTWYVKCISHVKEIL